MIKYRGTPEGLMEALKQVCPVVSVDSTTPEGTLTFRRHDLANGAIVNWWPKTGTVQVQGQNARRTHDDLVGVLGGRVP